MFLAHPKRKRDKKSLRLRGLKGANEEFLFAATAQNLKPLGKMVSCRGSKQLQTDPANSSALDRDKSAF